MSDKVFIVCAETNGVPHTADGVWFHVLGVFSEYALSEEFAQQQRKSGQWGEFRGEDGVGSDWFLEIHEREVQTEVKPFKPKTQKVEVGIAFAYGQWISKPVEVLEVDPERKDMSLKDRAILQAQSDLDARSEVSYAWIHYMASPDDEEESD